MFRRFSIRTLLVAIALAALPCSVLSWRHHGLANQKQAIQSLEALGAQLSIKTVADSARTANGLQSERGRLLRKILGMPDTTTSMVVLGSKIDSEDVLKMIPHLDALIPAAGFQKDGRPRIMLVVTGNSKCLTDELRVEIERDLTNCKLLDYSNPSRDRLDSNISYGFDFQY